MVKIGTTFDATSANPEDSTLDRVKGAKSGRFFDSEPPPDPLFKDWEPEPSEIAAQVATDDFPVLELPAPIREAVEAAADLVRVPKEMAAASAFTAISTAVQLFFSVRRDAHLVGPCSLFMLTVADPSERKTTIDKLFMQSLRDYDMRKKAEYKTELKRYKAQHKNWEEAGREMKGKQHEPAVLAYYETEPEPPRPRALLIEQATIEAIRAAFQDFPAHTITSNEGGNVFGGHSMQLDRLQDALATYNKLWDGGPLKATTKTAGTVDIDVAHLTMGIMLQPAVLEQLASKAGGLAKGIGFFARFLVAQPESLVGGRLYRNNAGIPEAVTKFNATLLRMLDSWEPKFDKFGRLKTPELSFDEHAMLKWVNFHDNIELKMGRGKSYHEIREVAGKAAEQVARLACCFHVFRLVHGHTGDLTQIAPGSAPPIDRDSMVAACAVVSWYLDEAQRLTSDQAEPPEIHDARTLEAYLVRLWEGRGGATAVTPYAPTVRDVGHCGPIRDKKRLISAIEVLVDCERAKTIKGARNKVQIALSPYVLRDVYDVLR
ncbi:YfjI family protein [Xanthobacter autotrophicus]|uniref:YfjI family protein n=1 Tax=Xanthobacter autotrophicus TaxID=280 RepID=UPI003729B023